MLYARHRIMPMTPSKTHLIGRIVFTRLAPSGGKRQVVGMGGSGMYRGGTPSGSGREPFPFGAIRIYSSAPARRSRAMIPALLFKFVSVPVESVIQAALSPTNSGLSVP